MECIVQSERDQVLLFAARFDFRGGEYLNLILLWIKHQPVQKKCDHSDAD